MTSKLNPIHSSSSVPGNPFSRSIQLLKQRISSLEISVKIGLGYAIALGIATIGTSTGVILGNYYQRQATALSYHTRVELELLNRLQTSILQARTHQQQFIPLLRQPDQLQMEYAHFLHHQADVKATWTDLETFVTQAKHVDPTHSDHIPNLLNSHEVARDAYFQQIGNLLQQIDAPHLEPEDPEKLEAAEQRLLTFTNSALALELDSVSDRLTEMIYSSGAENEKALANLMAAEALRAQIIAVSIVLSIAIATVLAVSTSRAIARPVRTVTKVAQQVTQNSDFDLKAPIETADEIGVLATSLNQLIERVKQLLTEQQAEASRRLLQSEKMSSLGQMIAGVAHEINNPVNFVYGNLSHASGYIHDLLELLSTYEAAIANPPSSVQMKAKDVDIEFLREDLPKLLQSMETGADRVRQIVLSLKNFSRLDEVSLHPVNLHECLDSTLLILNNRMKKGVVIQRSYGNIPLIEGYPGALYQVFMNLLSNALDAIESCADCTLEESAQAGHIVITTKQIDANWVSVRIADNGTGIEMEHQAKIFETFFTTKPIGVGTGLGLSISHEIVVEKHGGSLTFTSEPGKGTEFAIDLPIKHALSLDPMPQLPLLTNRSA